MSTGHGGSRPGAGRKPSSLTTRTREIAEAAMAGGLTPLEYILSLMRDTKAKPEARFEAAKAAAPYVHPRLSSIEASGPDGGGFVITLEPRGKG